MSRKNRHRNIRRRRRNGIRLPYDYVMEIKNKSNPHREVTLLNPATGRHEVDSVDHDERRRISMEFNSNWA